MYSLRNRRDFLPVYKARTNKFYIGRQCMYIVYLFFTKIHLEFTSQALQTLDNCAYPKTVI